MTVDRVRATLRWTGDWAGAAAFAALERLAAVYADRLEEAHREIGRLNTVIDEREASLATRNTELARAEEALTEAHQLDRDRETLRGWLAVPLSRVKEIFGRRGS